MDVLSNLYSIDVSLGQLQRSRTQLTTYLQKFRNRLKGKNRVYVTQVVRLMDSLSGYLEKKATCNDAREGTIEVSELMSGKGVDQINLYKLMNYLRESKLARKVEGYAIYIDEQKDAKKDSRQATTPVLMHIHGFFEALTYPAAEGRFFYSKAEDSGISIKYMLLDPTHHFKEIVEEARSVILAGGTMSPVYIIFYYLNRKSADCL